MRLPAREAHSYRRDEAVPGFDDRGPIVFMDGECLLCTRGAQMIAKRDRTGTFRICPIKSPLGRSVMGHYGLDADDPTSWLYLCEGRAYTSLDAIIRVGWRLGGWGHLLRALFLLPRPAQDWLYRRIAHNRYLAGRTDMCAVPDPALRQRLIS